MGINLILCLIFLFEKNIKNIEKYVKIKEKRIWFLYKLDFLILFVYFLLYCYKKFSILLLFKIKKREI